MTLPSDIEGLVEVIGAMDRPALVALLRESPCPFPVDFTDEYLNTIGLERLRHLTLAVLLQARKSARGSSAA